MRWFPVSVELQPCRTPCASSVIGITTCLTIYACTKLRNLYSSIHHVHACMCSPTSTNPTSNCQTLSKWTAHLYTNRMSKLIPWRSARAVQLLYCLLLDCTCVYGTSGYSEWFMASEAWIVYVHYFKADSQLPQQKIMMYMYRYWLSIGWWVCIVSILKTKWMNFVMSILSCKI